MIQQPSFFNTMGRKLAPFEPLTAGTVRLYTCGPTVYNNAHIGNLRSFLFEDVLRRALRFLGYTVTQVMNITDVDDKTIERAQERGQSLAEYTEPFIASFFRDLDTLHVERAEHYPRATEHIPEMIALVESLVTSGHAYEADGSVFFRIAADADYGRLSGFDLAEVQRGERVATDEYSKEDLRDFVLWKGAKAGEPSWDSPWGPGRPGWHIECSAMSIEYLGETFDMHTGGVDNIFPHHENEIAQSESATGKPFANYWLHAEHLVVDGEKMSKSLGNFYTLSDLEAKGVAPRALRYLLLGTHYRKKLNFTFDGLEDAANALRRIDEMRFRLAHARERGDGASRIAALCATAKADFTAALADDLNVAGGLGALFTLVKAVNVVIERDQVQTGDRDLVTGTLARMDEVLGVLDAAEWATAESATSGPSDAEIDALVKERQAAREGRDFARADAVRDQLVALDVVVEDTPAGPRWKRRG
jgi:cysteinyl-tRNA synthetase